jgi:hypothetical protein
MQIRSQQTSQLENILNDTVTPPSEKLENLSKIISSYRPHNRVSKSEIISSTNSSYLNRIKNDVANALPRIFSTIFLSIEF